MSSITFGIVKTAAQNKQLKTDDNGYYYVTLGAINCFNSGGQFYLQDGVKDLIENQSNLFARRLASGYLHGEMDHPQMRAGISSHDFLLRNLKIDHANISHHIKSVEMKPSDEDSGLPGKGNIIKVMGWVKPAGPKGSLLKESLDNDDANTSFSIRCLTSDTPVQGTIVKRIVQIITWDWVMEPGIKTANKWNTAAMETLDLFTFVPEDLERYLKTINKPSNQLSREDSNVKTMLSELTSKTKVKPKTNEYFFGWSKR